MRPIDLVVQRLREHGCKPRRVGKGWQALCPAHEDKNPSLNASEDMKGNVGIKCFANCATERVIAVLGLDWSDLFADNDRRRSMNILDTYPYVDEQGTTLFEVVRLSPKDFRQRRPDGNGGWSWKLDGVRRVPYRLNQVIEAIKNGELVIVTEGEKDTHTLEALGYTATTCPGGAGKWRNEYNQHFDGASVAVLGDNDPAGVANRNAIWSSLRDSGYPQDVIGLQVPDGYKDISEYVAAVGEANAREQVLRFTQFSIVRLPEEEDEEDKQAAADRHHLTDVGNARRFVAIAQGRIKYVHAWQKWIYWERGVWVIDEGEVLTRELAKQVPSNMLKFAAGDALTKDEREDLVNWALASESSGRIAAMVRESHVAPPECSSSTRCSTQTPTS